MLYYEYTFKNSTDKFIVQGEERITEKEGERAQINAVKTKIEGHEEKALEKNSKRAAKKEIFGNVFQAK